MSKSPLKDFSRLIDTAAKTAKKEESRGAIPPSQPPRYDLGQSFSVLAELKSKLESALRHNTRLLDENSTLGEMANDLRHQLRLNQDQLESAQKQITETQTRGSQDRQNLILEIEAKQRGQEEEVARLIREVSLLQEEKNALEMEKSRELEKVRIEYEGNLLSQLENVRRVQSSAKELYEAEVRNLREALSAKESEMEQAASHGRVEQARIGEDKRALEKQLKHLRNSHSLELAQLKQSFSSELKSMQMRLQHEKQLEIGNKELRMRHLSKDLAEKTMELEHATRKMTHHEEVGTMESIQRRREKEELLSELKSNDLQARTLLSKEKNRLEELARMEAENMTKLFETQVEELNGENFKLKQLIECKKEELKYFYEENNRIKESYGQEMDLIQQENKELQNKLKDFQLEAKEEGEAFKTKMAKLLQNDIEAMGTYYQNQLSAYMKRVAEQDKLIEGMKERLYKGISQNDDIRRTLEVEIGKQKARVQDLKIKMANQHLEHKEHVSNLGSKIQLTSQTLIRETEHKDKTKAQYEEEKRKFHQLANSKDKEIAELMSLLENMKRLHEDEVKGTRNEVHILREQLRDSQDALKKAKDEAEEELKRKDEKMMSLEHSNEEQLKEIRDLEDKVEVLEKNQLKYKKQIDHLQMVNASITQELGLSKGFIENLQLESNAAIEDERSKLKTFMGTHEISIRDYYEDKIKTRERDIEHLQRQLSEKEEDIRDLIVKYKALDERFTLMMDSNKKLSEFEEKVRELGLDGNLVKNMAELFKKQK